MIQDIVQETKGSPLGREAVRRVEAILTALARVDGAPIPTAGYSAREATILFADLRGFSALASTYSADAVIGVLNRCFAIMVEIIVRHYGTIDKFMGDAIMAVFHGDPVVPQDHARRALLCAVEMQIAMHKLHEEHPRELIREIYMGIGISTGRVTAGLIGSDVYRAYTVIGDEVNLAARIEAFSLRGQVLMSEATYDHCRDFINVSEPMDVYVKGRAALVRVREALGIPALGKVVPRQDVRKSPRIPVRLDLDYWSLDGKMVYGQAMRGIVRDIGYHGILAELGRPIQLYSELKLAFDLPPIAFRAEEIYARVVSTREHGQHLFVGLEFTSLGRETNTKIERFVQMLLQGEYG